MTDEARFQELSAFLGLAGHLLSGCAEVRYLLDSLEGAILRGDDETLAAFRARYKTGRTEHADSPDNWRGWTRSRFTAETLAEIHDAVIYSAEARRRGFT